MSLITEEFKPTVNTLEEVKKLQELVRKLEIQNLHLRNKQNSKKQSGSPSKEQKTLPQYSVHVTPKNSNLKDDPESDSNVETSKCRKDEYFDELDIIKVSDIEMSDDESWLYISPRSIKQQKNESLYKWLRKDVDDGENHQLQLAKNALLSKLTELDICPNSLISSNQVENPTISNLKRSQISLQTPLTAQIHDSARVDTRTFTRSKKKQAIEFLEKLDMLNTERTEKNYLTHLRRKGSDVSSDSISSCHVLEDASDVEEVARMQEESLRMGSPLGTPKRNACNVSRKISSSSRGSVSDQELSESSVIGAVTIENSSVHEHFESNSYTNECLTHSDQSSPSESPYSSNVSLHHSDDIQGKVSGYRRSLPNLTREPLTVRQSKISHSAGIRQSKIKSSSIRKTDTFVVNTQKSKKDNSSSLKIQLSNQVSSTSKFQTSPSLENMITVSKISETPNLRIKSGLPRPSRASSASRSGIPTPALSKRHEDSWSEGCF